MADSTKEIPFWTKNHSLDTTDNDDVGMHDNYLFKKYTSPANESRKSGNAQTDSSYTEIVMFTKDSFFL